MMDDGDDFFSLFYTYLTAFISTHRFSHFQFSPLSHKKRGMSGCVVLSYCVGLNCNSKRTQTHYTQILTLINWWYNKYKAQ